MTDRLTVPIRINHPRRLPAWSLPAERIPVCPGYKPSMALLPDGSLVMTALVAGPEDEVLPEGKVREWTGIWWSDDGGRTWTDMKRILDMIGREQWLTCTSTGALFASSHHLIQDVTNEYGYVGSWLHRSTDGGRTWDRTRATVNGALRCGMPQAHGSHTSRNIVELPDGTLLFGASICSSNVAYMWKSADNGNTWDKTQKVKIKGYYGNLNAFFCEDFTYRNESGRLLHWCRMSPLDYGEGAERSLGQFPMGDRRVVPTGDDGINRLMTTTSDDDGVTWSPLRDFGDYGRMYPRVTRLRDGRVLMTCTQRALLYPIGLQALLSYDDGETWDHDDDQIVIEGFTPWGAEQGGGFGNTLQLADGTLASCYSYRADDNETYIEIVTWNLP